MLNWLRYKVLHRPVRLAVRYDRVPAMDGELVHRDKNGGAAGVSGDAARASGSTRDGEVGGMARGRAMPTIVFLHGIAASSNTWRDSLKRLEIESSLMGCRLVALDWLGFGRSLHAKWLKYNYSENCVALTRTLEKLQVDAPVILVGHSMGGLIAAKYSLAYPRRVRGLVLVSPPLIMPAEIARIPDRFYLKTYAELQEIAKTAGGKAVAAFANQLTSFESKYLHTPAFEHSMKQIILNRHNYDALSSVKVPTVIIHGRFDPLVYKPNLEKVVRHNAHAKLMLSMSHHDINPAKYARILQALKEMV